MFKIFNDGLAQKRIQRNVDAFAKLNHLLHSNDHQWKMDFVQSYNH